MNVPNPAYISARLMAAVDVMRGEELQGTVSVICDGGNDYRWRIDTRNGHETGTDLRRPGADDYGEVLETLIMFLCAAAESYPDGENADLFREDIVKWAVENADELAMLGFDFPTVRRLGDGGNPIAGT